MIYLPKAFERYISALRLYVQMSVLRGGSSLKHLRQLKKISVAEALYLKDERSPVDIISLSNSLLGSAVIILLQRGIRLSVSLSGDGVYAVNRRLYTALLHELATGFTENGCKISIKAEKNRFIIKAGGCRELGLLARLIKSMNGFFLYERVKNTVIISIPAEKTQLKAEPVENEWCYLLDRFSPVNIWFLNIRDENVL